MRKNIYFLRVIVNGYFKGGLKMEVVKVTENEDGSATLDLNLEEEEVNIFVGYAINDILKKQIKKLEDKQGDA
jgi:hypothetical protein